MMFQQMAEMLYYYILRSEMVFLRMYKTNPFEIDRDISLLDLHTYMTTIQKEIEKENKQQGNNKVMNCLRGVCDYLNMMFYTK